MNASFQIFAQLPAGLRNAPAVIAACRAGGVGVINAEFGTDSEVVAAELAQVASRVASPFGVSADAIDERLADSLRAFAPKGLRWLILDPASVSQHTALLSELRAAGVRVLVRITAPQWPADLAQDQLDGIVLKGHEAGGFVGEDGTFLLLQKWLGAASLPLYIHGGVTPHVAAACSAFGVAGGILDSQLLLLDDVHPPTGYRNLFGKLAGSETVAVGSGEFGEYFRILVRPGHNVARAFTTEGEGQRFDALRITVGDKVDWNDLRGGLLPIGQDICFAATWYDKYRNFAGLFRAIETSVGENLRAAVKAKSISAGAPLARALNVPLPIVQGPMTRVSDKAEFAQVIAEGGALPMVALAVLKGTGLKQLLADTAEILGDRPWGIGLLGFAPKALFDEQLAAALEVSPDYAIIAGGRPDQAVLLEASGIPSFLHVPAAALIGPFMRGGARRFIFEGRECGGHIGPLSSFVLWSTMVAKLVEELEQGSGVRGDEMQVLFAGGIHDAVSSAMVQVLAAPLAAKGVNVGILMGSAYLFTKEIVDSGAIVQRFQDEVLACDRTVALTSGPGHASRCAYTPFAEEFFRAKERLEKDGVPSDEARKVLDDLIIGRLRIASKGLERSGPDGQLESLDETVQHTKGMYMLGQVATLRSEIIDVATLHRQVSEGAGELLAASLRQHEEATAQAPNKAADVAIIGIGSIFPGANTTDDYWDNILDNVDAITEIPRHRWDWRLYFDEDRTAKDKIYSKWGGFLDDLVFDPTRFGMPPRSVSAVDPMQLIALEAAHRTLKDAGYADRGFNHERTSIVLGSSGGTGDVGTQYCLRSELPRYTGELPDHIADQLPEWTEDSFAGILANVVAGRVANRLNFGGVNFTTDAACASSLASVYQAVNELTSRRSDLVIAGGVDTVQGPFGYLCFSKTQALSPRGRCASFDAKSDGIVISEGVAMVALKRLEDAERDGDRIYAVIKGVAGSSDGKARGMTAPVPAGQLRAMRRAYTAAGFDPSTVGLFEAHGTGTVAGDIAELKSTTQLVRESGGRPHQSVIGSVKTMIGHTKSTAGMAGLIKVALALHRRVLPPHRGVEVPNPVLRRDSCPLHLIDEARPWLARPEQPRRGAVSAFGFGGTNFHVVMEEPAPEYRTWLKPTTGKRWPAELLLWSAENTDGLVADLERMQAAMAGDKAIVLRDLAAGLAQRFRSGGETVAIVASTPEELSTLIPGTLDVLRGNAEQLPKGVHRGSSNPERGKVAVLFSGQGSQYPEMFRELMVHFGVCADTLAEADELLREPFEERFGGGRTLSQFIFPRASYDTDAKREAKLALTATDVAQPALGAVDAAAFHLMQWLGLEADVLGGHSYGEFVALYAGGAIDFASMLALSAARGRAIVDASKASGVELGTMAAVLAPRDQVEAAIADIDDVVIANHNAPEQIVLSGSHAAVAKATEALAKQGARISEFPVAAGFHSPQVHPAGQALRTAIEGTHWAPASTPVYSNTTAEPHASDVETVKQVMGEHLVRPVEFVAQTEAMYRDGARIFVELGPKSVLSRLVDRVLEGRPHIAVSIDRKQGLQGLLGVLAQLICAGVELDATKLFENRAAPLPDPYALPETPVVPKHAWIINGAGARQAGSPPQQVGITQEQVQARAQAPVAAPAATATAPPAARPPVAAPHASPATPSVMTAPAAETRSGPKTTPVRTRPAADAVRAASPPPASIVPTRRSKAATMTDHDQNTMNGYFSMMRQFLETQERVMSMYLRGSTGVQPARSRVPAERVLPPANPMAPGAALIAPAVAAVPSNGVPAPAARAPATPSNGVPSNGAHAPVAAVPTNGAAQAAPAPQPAASAPAPAAAPPAAASGPITLDRAALADMLLGVVEDKTGYPRDMVDLSQNLESDLGIDSIKRVEVASAMMELLPESYRTALAANLGELNTQPTLDGMLTILGSVNGQKKETSVPFDVPEAGVVADVGHPPRYEVVAREQPLPRGATHRLHAGAFVIADDALGLADALAQRITDAGGTVHRVGRDTLADEAALQQWIDALQLQPGTLGGIVHLAGIGSAPVGHDATLEDWRGALQLHEKSLFLLVRGFQAPLADDAHVLAATGLGGTFGRGDATEYAGLQLQSGAVGLLKSHKEERPNLRAKTVDVDPSLALDALTQIVFDELTLVGGRLEIGYPQGRRTAFHTVETTLDPGTQRPALADQVVLATGGGRGVTAEVLRELAAPGNTLILTGRRPLPEAETPETAAATTAAELRNQLIAQVRSGTSTLKPAEIGRQVQATLAARELRNNIEDFRQRGATVEYHAVDVTDEPSLQALLDDIQPRLGAVTGVLHGAGIIEDKLLADKTSDSWSRVVETKVMGLLLLQKLCSLQTLQFFAVMSSVAGRYGNSGQADYATANEVMNRVCGQLRARSGGTLNAMALCWGPWGPTQFGQGMVTAAVEAKFAEKGVGLVSAGGGRQLFGDELRRTDATPVEIICGKGPWEETETELGAIEIDEAAAAAPAEAATEAPDDGAARGPLLGTANVQVLPKGDRILTVRLNANETYLRAHQLDGVAILPAAGAVELFAEAGAALWPGWKVLEVKDCRLLKGIDLKAGELELQLAVSPPTYGSSEGFEVNAALNSVKPDGSAGRAHYRCVLRLGEQFPETVVLTPQAHTERQLTVDKAYGEWLFHGECFQVIEKFDGLSTAGAQAVVRASSPAQWLDRASAQDRWVFDPALLDAGPQMAILWARSFRDQTVLPTRFGRVVRYSDTLPERMRMVFECLPSNNPSQVRACVYFLDSEDRVVLLVEDLEGVGSAALNRLARRPAAAPNLSAGTI